jgi:hypothetical protein
MYSSNPIGPWSWIAARTRRATGSLTVQA